MKKVLALVLCATLALSMVLFMGGCKSDEEKAVDALTEAFEDLL